MFKKSAEKSVRYRLSYRRHCIRKRSSATLATQSSAMDRRRYSGNYGYMETRLNTGTNQSKSAYDLRYFTIQKHASLLRHSRGFQFNLFEAESLLNSFITTRPGRTGCYERIFVMKESIQYINVAFVSACLNNIALMYNRQSI